MSQVLDLQHPLPHWQHSTWNFDVQGLNSRHHHESLRLLPRTQRQQLLATWDLDVHLEMPLLVAEELLVSEHQPALIELHFAEVLPLQCSPPWCSQQPHLPKLEPKVTLLLSTRSSLQACWPFGGRLCGCNIHQISWAHCLVPSHLLDCWVCTSFAAKSLSWLLSQSSLEQALST